MKLFVFAIGGTGERVLRSFTMLLAAGVPAFDNYEVYPIIIDYDSDNADKKRTVDLLQNYAAVHNAAFLKHTAATNNQGLSNQFFAAKLCQLAGMNNYLFPFAPATPNVKFRQHIGYDYLAGETLRTKQLLTSLYDESNRADTELNLDMTVGFKGNPNIGSVVFHDINKGNVFNNFVQLFQPGSDDKVVIIGSLFGGTGASGIPEIVKAIDANCQNAKIATILVLPYFAPMDNKNKNNAIKASRFNSKTKAALSFYQDSGLMNKIDKIYYVGDPYPTVIPYCDGGDKQQNNANIVELISAMMIEHYVSGRGNGNKEFKFSLNANIVVKQDQRSGQRLFVDDFDKISTDVVLQPLIRFAIALKVFHDEIHTNNASNKDFYKILSLGAALAAGDGVNNNDYPLRDLCKELLKYYAEYHAWYKELDYEGDGNNKPANAHRFALCDMENNYPDIILKQPIAGDGGKQGNTFGRVMNSILNKNNSLSADYLLTRMNYHLKDNGDGNGHYDTKVNSLRTGHEAEWVFADILYRAAIDGFTQL